MQTRGVSATAKVRTCCLARHRGRMGPRCLHAALRLPRSVNCSTDLIGTLRTVASELMLVQWAGGERVVAPAIQSVHLRARGPREV